MVSIAAASGVPIAVIAKIVGHKRVSTTQDLYSHLFESDARAASNAVSSAVNRAFAEEARRRNPTSG
jgi:integrase